MSNPLNQTTEPPGIYYLTEQEHLNRMAEAIYACQLRRITIIRPWIVLSDAERDGYRDLARLAVAGCDALRIARMEKVDGGRMSQEQTPKYCITCSGSGHTYLECPEVSFGDILAGALGMRVTFSGKTRDEIEATLRRLEDENGPR